MWKQEVWIHGSFAVAAETVHMFLGHLVEHPVHPGVDLTTFLSRSCHRGFNSIPVTYTNFSKKYTRTCTNFQKMHAQHYTNYSKSIPDQIFHTKILKISTVSCTKIVKIDTIPYTSIWKIDTLRDGTSPYPKYM